MADSYTRLLYHLVFSTKDRRALITPQLAQDLHPYFGGIIRNIKGVALEIGGVSDHVHLLVGLSADVSVAQTVSKIKANSSKRLLERLGKGNWFGWQVGYGAFTVSASQEDIVRRYIQNQEIHHRKRTYKEELVVLLTRHRIPFEE